MNNIITISVRLWNYMRPADKVLCRVINQNEGDTEVTLSVTAGHKKITKMIEQAQERYLTVPCPWKKWEREDEDES